jgi:hypothetical protein
MKNIWLGLIRHRKLIFGILIWLVLIAAITWAGKGLFKYRFYSTHDLDHHLARGFDAIRTFAEGQFPLRWAGTMNYGCGVPIFNFFYPLLYYLIVIIFPFSKDMFLSFKLISFASLFVGTVFFYLWSRKETGDKWVGLAGAILYLYAPYRFLLIYVRGSPEYLAYALWPVVLYFYSLAFKEVNFKKFLWFCFFAALSGGLLVISHNFTVMFLMPILLLYLILKFFFGQKLEKKRIFLLILAYLSAFGLGAFFIFPAFLEMQFTKLPIPAFTYYDHFPELWQVFNSKWGYFYSFPGTKDDGMSFQLGYAHWAVLVAIFSWIVWRLVSLVLKGGRILNFLKENIWIVVFFALAIFTLFLTLPYSRFIWDKIPLLQDIQFPWRLLGIDVLAISTLFVYWLSKIKSKFFYWALLIGIPILAFVGDRNHLLPEPVLDETAKYYENPSTIFTRYSLGNIGADVLPANMQGTCSFTDKFVSNNLGKGDISYKVIERKGTQGNVAFLINDSIKPNGEKIVFDLSYFPGIFRINVNGQEKVYQDCKGHVCLPRDDFKEGENFVSWKVGQSKIENTFNYLTLAFILIWILMLSVFLTGIYKNKQKLTYFVFTIVILFLFIFFRSYNLSGRIGFGWDQERDAVAAINILAGKLTLLGPRVQGPASFFLPPYFFYMIAPFYALAGQNPFATTGFIVFWSLLFFTLSYLTLSKVFDKKAALIFLALWAVNPLSISIDTIAWNPVVVPLLFILLIYLIYLCFKNLKIKYLILSGLVFGLGTSFHLQFLFTLPIFIPLLISLFKGKKFGGLICLLAGFILPFLPIFLFDLRHNFLNISQITGFIKSGSTGINRVLPVWGRALSSMTGSPASIALGLAIYLSVLVGLFVIGAKLKDKVQGKVVSSLGFVWAASLPLFYLIIKNPSEYYFNYLLVPLLVFISLFLKNWKRLGILVVAGISAYFIFQATPLLRNVPLGLKEKDQAVSLLSSVTKDSSPFNVSFDVPFNEDTGFRYLLNYYKVGYSGNPKDPLIEFIIPYNKRPNTFTVGQIGIYLPAGWLKDNWPSASK